MNPRTEGPRLPFRFRTACLALALLAGACSEPATETADLYRAPAIPNVVDDVVFEAGNWEPHLAAGEEGVSWGNHRAVVVIEEEGDAVLVTVPWRRSDADPSAKGIIVVDAASGEAVADVLPLRIENASGDVVFRPNPGSTTYHIYYLPWQSTGGYYPTMTYPTQEEIQSSAGAGGVDRDSPSRADQSGQADLSWEGRGPNPDPSWAQTVRATALEAFPRARTTHIQSVDDFHSFFPMEVIASSEEAAEFMAGAPGGWTVVPEHRDYPVRMKRFIPLHWVKGSETSRMPTNSDGSPALRSASSREAPQARTARPQMRPLGSAETPQGAFFASRIHRNEAFTFQLALVSGMEPLSDVRVAFQDFPASWPEDALTCFNCEGIDQTGTRFEKELDVPAGTLQPLWLGIRVPADQAPGLLEGTVTVSTASRGEKSVRVSLEVLPGMAPDGGEDTPELMTRLAWLNSTVGTDPDFIIEPFEPVVVEFGSAGEAAGSVAALSILGRRVQLAESGLPHQILSYYTPELTHFAARPEPILARPMELEVSASGQGITPTQPESFEANPFTVEQESAGRAHWTAESASDHFTMTVEGALEYDGMLDYRISLVARTDVAVEDIALPISLQPDAADYMLGLGRKGGLRPAAIDWKWAVENHQEGVWLGAVHKGLQYVLRDDNYIRPLNTNFYRNQPLNMPPSWFNEGRGGIRIREEREPNDLGAGPTAVTARNYSGPRALSAGDTLHFNVRFLITPFKPIDTEAHFNTRFVHQYVPVDSVRAWGGTVVNIHHANAINPYINYPFFALEDQAAYVDEAHEKGIKVKLYNTIRELTYKTHELFALRSLGDEILNDGEGGGHSWMQEHLQDQYHSAWHAARTDDAAMLNKGTSRWTNYYIEGIRWLAENQHIDGLYLDDIAFSRETVKRMVTVMNQHRPQVVIDLHSANQFNVRDGFTNSAMLYMEHFPFISRLWFGEYFEYDLDEDYWMTEVSGLPFGLMGEMLQDGGHPYRGMLYGMTARKYGNVDPRPVWAMMNDFGIAESEMLGYWLEEAPVTTDNPRVLATTYIRDDAVLIALASWSDQDEVVDLNIEHLVWGPFGRAEANLAPPDPPYGLRIFTPAVDGLQEESVLDFSGIRVPAGMGLWVIIEPPGSG